METRTAHLPELSVVIPILNESACIGELLVEVLAVLYDHVRIEIVVVDDGSTDNSVEVVRREMTETREIRLLRHPTSYGQSAAILSGVRAARARWIATLDGDGQNNPADIVRLLEQRALMQPSVKLLAGWRVERRDSWSKRLASRIANRIRAFLLRDETPDTGCGIKLFEREAFLDLPYFDHMHRYLPALFRRAGWRSVSVPVSHRPRVHGTSKYTNWRRALVGLRDLFGVSWLIARSHRISVEEVTSR